MPTVYWFQVFVCLFLHNRCCTVTTETKMFNTHSVLLLFIFCKNTRSNGVKYPVLSIWNWVCLPVQWSRGFAFCCVWKNNTGMCLKYHTAFSESQWREYSWVHENAAAWLCLNCTRALRWWNECMCHLLLHPLTPLLYRDLKQAVFQKSKLSVRARFLTHTTSWNSSVPLKYLRDPP